MKATEKNYINLIRKRREEGLLYAVETYGWVIQSVVRKHLFLLPDLQQECMNDVLMAVWQHIGDFDPTTGSFQNWAAGIARFKAIDCKRNYLRRSRKYVDIEGQFIEDEHAGRQMLKVELDQEIKELFEQLSQPEREIFQKHFIEEATIEEISAEMGLNESTIYQRISRGRKKLRQYEDLGEAGQ